MDYRIIILTVVTLTVGIAARSTLDEKEEEVLVNILEDMVAKQSRTPSLREVISAAVKDLESRRKNDQEFFEKTLDKKPSAKTSSGMLAIFNSADEKKNKLIEGIAAVTLTATEKLIGSGQVKLAEGAIANDKLQNEFKSTIKGFPFFAPCFTPIPLCNASAEYRTATGECNNLANPLWGKEHTPQIRFLPADYDGTSPNAPKELSVVPGKFLPSARTVSINALRGAPHDTPDDLEKTVMVTAWGQFTDHDVVETPASSGYNGAAIECCSTSNRNNEMEDLLPVPLQSPSVLTGKCMNTFSSMAIPQCFPITIEANDPHFNTTCMNFVRSLPAVSFPCALGVRENINAITSYIDASNVYGSDDATANSLRTPDGFMKVAFGNMLPPDSDPDACTLEPSPPYPPHHCQKAGDIRVNEIQHLSMLHLAFVREHNRLANKLKGLNPTWGGDTLYQETRKIIGALMQLITYNEWLPIVLGDAVMLSEGLSLSTSYTYEPNTDASVRNAFAAAALRYGHSLVDTHQTFLYSDFFTKDERNIENTFFRPAMVFENPSSIARWASFSSCKKSDKFFVKGVQDLLFQDSTGLSFDLVALNIQRGRDHGIPSYTSFLAYCSGLPVPTSFNALPYHSADTITAFSNTYEHVNDIDLFAGAMSENHLPGANVGPTFACLLGRQFRAAKYGDRFWYQNTADVNTRFTAAQIQSIEKVRLAKILCEVFDLDRIQLDVFRPACLNNPWKSCCDIEDIDLTPWVMSSSSPSISAASNVKSPA